MNNVKLDNWANLLLDTGKRNNLINFKDTKLSTVEVIAPACEEFYNKISHINDFEAFNYDNSIYEVDSSDPTGHAKKRKILDKHEVYNLYGDKINKNQILLFNSKSNPQNVVANIRKRSVSAIEETGVNITYLAFGFVTWTEDTNSQYTYKAPIVLLPVTIEYESIVDPFKVKIIDSEPIVNPTFSFKLENEYGISLPTFDEDEEIGEYFNKIEEILSNLKWKVLRECKLGLFSFLKINMYSDIKSNSDKILENTNILKLMGEPFTDKCDDANSFYEITEEKLLNMHNVVDADSSQSEAIEMAKEGRSFVLQGPPGTGKSQTITNIIAECLSDGKKVLFVAEKLAALNVVYDKLKNAGLEDFCLELHSHKANKLSVITELCNTLRAKTSVVSRRAQKEVNSKVYLQNKLNEYVTELHKVRPVIQKSLYNLLNEVAFLRDYKPIDFIIKDISNKGEEYLDKCETLLSKYVDYTSSVGYDYHNYIWYGFKGKDTSFEAVANIKNILIANEKMCIRLKELIDEINDVYNLNMSSINDVSSYDFLFELLCNSKYIGFKNFDENEVNNLIDDLNKMKLLADDILEIKNRIEENYDENIYDLEGDCLNKQLTREFHGFFSRAFNKQYKNIIKQIKLCKKSGQMLTYKGAVMIVDMLLSYQNKISEFLRYEGKIKHATNDAYNGIYTNFDEFITEIINLSKFFNKLGKSKSFKLDINEEKERILQYSVRLNNLLDSNYSYVEELCNLFDRDIFDAINIDINILTSKCESCLSHVDELDNWNSFMKLIGDIKSQDLNQFVDYAIKNSIEISSIIPLFKKTFFNEWIDFIIHQSSILFEFTRIPHDKTVEQFKEKDSMNCDINRAIIKARLSSERPSIDMIAPGSATAILLREGEKKRKQKGIRQLFIEIPELILLLKPCLLMSPLSVSTFLSSETRFDVVIFDEASQIFPQDTIGAIYRAKQLIVVGDSKQMPPSNFFNSQVDLDGDGEDEDITDFESVLDLCSTTFAQKRLKWHYRSRFEDLIAFSNKNFYNNELLTFPANKSKTKGLGIDYVYANGTFDRQTKTNLVEAETIVDLVFDNIEKYPNRSLGVVAFSISQQNLIDTLISKRRMEDRSKEWFFKSDRKEPFFVKNLETVQGDERDTIIFSVAYAKDSQGRLLLNFGPVNRDGGERRLNVAFTRAKYNVQLVTSMHYTDIDLARTRSLGVKLLREYLDYAENGSIALERSITVNPIKDYDSEFEMEVSDFLQEHGYEVDAQVGCSSYRIDIAVKNPDTSDYVLAIECDGASYHSSKTARDRDRLRQSVLESMGWKFYRIWSTDWFRNNTIEKNKLLLAVEDAFNNSTTFKNSNIEGVASLENEESADNGFEVISDHKEDIFPIYKEADIKDIVRQSNGNILEIVKRIMEVEAPISEEWLLRRIAFLFNREKVTNIVRDAFDREMMHCYMYGIVRENGFLYLKNQDVPMLRIPLNNSKLVRDFKYIAIEELANGIREVLKQNICVEQDGLLKLLSQKLGFSRVGDAMRERFSAALDTLSEEIYFKDTSIMYRSK